MHQSNPFDPGVPCLIVDFMISLSNGGNKGLQIISWTTILGCCLFIGIFDHFCILEVSEHIPKLRHIVCHGGKKSSSLGLEFIT